MTSRIIDAINTSSTILLYPPEASPDAQVFRDSFVRKPRLHNVAVTANSITLSPGDEPGVSGEANRLRIGTRIFRSSPLTVSITRHDLNFYEWRGCVSQCELIDHPQIYIGPVAPVGQFASYSKASFGLSDFDISSPITSHFAFVMFFTFKN